MLEEAIRYSSKPWEIISTYSSEAFTALLTGNEDILGKFPLFNMDTVPFHYEALMCQLKESLVKSVKELDGREVLAVIQIHSACFSNLVELGKNVGKRNILNAAMKHCRSFVDSFAKVCLPVFDRLFATEKPLITSILKSVQNGTRIIQVYPQH